MCAINNETGNTVKKVMAPIVRPAVANEYEVKKSIKRSKLGRKIERNPSQRKNFEENFLAGGVVATDTESVVGSLGIFIKFGSIVGQFRWLVTCSAAILYKIFRFFLPCIGMSLH